LPKGSATLKNYICLPGDLNPESLLAEFLDALPDAHPFWRQKNAHYSHQVCFKNYDVEDIKANRVTAKKWYLEQVKLGGWGRGANNVYKHYLETIPEHKKIFVEQFKNVYESALK
ncbi:hypothetical protein LRP50_11725, partial [Enterovibrio sp. ZSDZ42]|nr:hypothetical protein [Enterovibrio sp. ZSDZ42]